ncbi:MAG: hypothetical protein KAZ63_06440 [Vitreoscilla sp.]|nr:hypothetical protein [Vitreoscilla sp.]
MDLLVDIGRNQITLQGRVVTGHHRWEAAALAVLVLGEHNARTRACEAGSLNGYLRSIGQEQPLNRKQLSRLWASLHAMWAEAGCGDDFELRFRHPPRGATVGPWWWEAPAGDQVQLAGSTIGNALDQAVKQASGFALPMIAADASSRSTLMVCRQLMNCQILLDEGEVAAAKEQLESGEAWALASVEVLALRECRLAQVHIGLRQFDLAREALARAQGLAGHHGTARAYLGNLLHMQGQRLSYFESPLESYSALLPGLRNGFEARPGQEREELDAYNRSLRLNLASLCERRRLEAQLPGMKRHDLEQAFELSSAYSFAALFGFMTINQHRLCSDVVYNYASVIQRACEMKLGPTPTEVLTWYQFGLSWLNKFDMTQHSVWGSVFLGYFWLDHPEWHGLFVQTMDSMRWPGLRPDQAEFYAFASNRAAEIGDPRVLAKCLLNEINFANSTGQRALAAAKRLVLQDLLARHPDVQALVVAEGRMAPGRP